MATYKGPAGLLIKFRDVTRSRIGRLMEGLHDLGGGDGDEAAVAALMREIHTVKGEAKMMGFEVMNLVAHHTENLLLAARDAGFQVSEDDRDKILYGCDLLAALSQDEPVPEEETARAARAFLDGKEVGAASPPAETRAEEAPARSSSVTPRARGEGDGLDVVRLDAAALGTLTRLSGELARCQQHSERLLAELLRLTTEIGRTESADLKPSAIASAQGEVSAARPAPHRRGALAKEMTAVIARLQEEGFETSLHVGELQETVRRIRMYPVRTLLEGYPAAIRGMARELGKKVEVTVDAGQVIVDKQVVDQLGEPLVHLIRNSVDHGIETGEERQAAGKSPRGSLLLSARQVSGAQVEIVVQDDGRGIDPARVRSVAISRGICTPAEAEGLTDEATLWLLFQPGFSTSADITLMSGRGVGLDVVKKAIEGVGGSVHVETRLGQGTTFRLRVPISVALTRALIVEGAVGLCALPSTSVVLATRVNRADVSVVGDGSSVRIDGEAFRLLDLDELLGQGATAPPPVMDVVVLGDGEQRVALRVGRHIGEQQLVRQGLDGFLAGIPFLNGTAVLEGGRHCFFLNQSALFRSWGGPRAAARPHVSARRRRVLIVDDSEITRDMLVSVLRRLGCEVVEAVDGQDALERLANTTVDLVLTDLDMPLLDGFGLLRNLRSRSDTQDVPVVVLSTRGSSSDKTQAMAAGANAYIVKARFRQADLEDLLRLHLPE